ncbi:hypothetical protein [uncultured Helicobacter sp.]|uniref:hypothetical protein n=1 Tax=uncultured Helicobacter sp. TaxID=175537 RepID=UPI0037505002
MIGFLLRKNGRIYFHRFCSACACALHYLIFGKALLGFFSVVDSVSCLDSQIQNLKGF